MNIVAPVTNAVQSATAATTIAASNAYKVPSIKAAIHSAVITFAALAAGFLVQASLDTSVSPGAMSSLSALWLYVQGHWIGYAVAQVVAPALRAYNASKSTPS